MPEATRSSTTRRVKAPSPYANVIDLRTREPIEPHLRAYVRHPHDDYLLKLGEVLRRDIAKAGRPRKCTLEWVSQTKATTLAGVLVKARALGAIEKGWPGSLLDTKVSLDLAVALGIGISNDMCEIGVRS